MAKHLSTFAIAEMLHVDPGSVANWIDRDLLKAHRTPGGHRRVIREDLIVFLRKHKIPIPEQIIAAAARILIVADKAAVTRRIARAIQAARPECEIHEAHDGFHAGTIIATINPDVVILDLHVPGMDACEVCRFIKSRQSTRHAEILCIADEPSPETEKHVLECGARACIAKPPDMQRVLKEVGAALD